MPASWLERGNPAGVMPWSPKMESTHIHEASEELPMVTRYEPNFRRFYAKGAILETDSEPDEGLLRLSFWSSKANLVDQETNDEVVGYALEAEVVLTFNAAKRIRDLLGFWLTKHWPADLPRPDDLPEEE